MLGLVPNIRYRRDPITVWKQEQSSTSMGSVFLHAAVLNDLLEVHALIQVDGMTFAGDVHLEELFWFSKVSALPLVHELHFDRINYGLIRATEEGVINVYYSDNNIGALLLVEEDACFRLKVLKPKFFEGLIECAPPS
ncbi:hypothetical protein SCLCIDRAFT_34865 [Scleroderma citrinum Foug A]|uniref:Uncharacterized protein n=1 Tax=Scleroderma citrinum Foug A TaxID=1036808 RepID=A0A0C2ZA10_9AGAM|nr:hypothetical protein SCLCIDRAFT_34865 [Scleroderma citrinum Foug A]